MTYKWCVLLSAFSFLVLVVVPVAAAEDDEAMSLEEMVVTSGRVPEPKREVTSNITVVGEEEIKQSSARDLGELLAEKNIGAVRQYPTGKTQIGIRGFRTDSHGNDLKGRVLILLNGRRAGTGNASKIMTENIERVEIIRGPASVQYGSAAIGGVINVITKEGEGKPSGFVNGKFGNYGYEKTFSGMSGELGSFDFSGTVSRSSQDDYDTGEGEQYENTGYDEKEKVSLNLGYEILPQNRLSVVYNGYYADEIGSPGKIANSSSDSKSDQHNESVDFMLDGSSEGINLDWKAKYFIGDDFYDYFDPSHPYKRDTDQQGAQAQITWSPSKYRISAGVDWVNYEISEKSVEPPDTYRYKYEYDNPSLYLLSKAKLLNEKLILMGGLRYDEYEIGANKQGFSDEDNHISPKLGIAYFLQDNVKFRANYSQGYQIPGAEQMAGSQYSFYNYKENFNLDPEKSETYEIGFDYYKGALDYSLTFFYSEIDDRIVSEKVKYDPVTSQTTYQYENIDEATVSGFEGQMSYDVGALFGCPWQIQPYVNFTYLTELEDEEEENDIYHVSDMNVSYGISIADNNGFFTRLNFSYVGDQDIEVYDPVTYEPTRAEKSGFTVANLTIQKRILDFNSYGDLSLRGEVRNLFDKDYSYVEGYPMPGQSFVLGMEYSF